ncbi:tRNA (adenosine(37)-N6)-dimethylallyltransferase MiaA [Sphingomonas mesophila]|uniref:tRNA (adenosine(37)-N6)-dimethylallyltransferase MiaA n=1 Tax=Sphingomonas mesophila TaxID=2303576 RepID=UPI001F07A451|nr:tRNA (adenosine(37)-N6)-dimethylallyltransferase MiaA [Sphingomonas mesophila]
MRPPLLVIAGPTASGKSALALACARAVGGTIVNADASQLYRDIPILSAAPSAVERAEVAHLLYGVRDGAEPCSAAEWAELAQTEIADIHRAGGTPLLVGGTGLYFRTLIEGIAPVPQIDHDVRSAVRGASVEDNRRALERLDAAGAARIGPRDTARIARALEVVQSTGRTLGAWQSEKTGGIGEEVTVRAIVLVPPRDWLYGRCEARFTAMIEEGAISEVEALLARGLDAELPVMRAIGVREIAAFLRGETDRAAMIAAGQQATRNYAKRQYTWFAHQPPAEWVRFGDALDSDSVIASASEAIQ